MVDRSEEVDMTKAVRNGRVVFIVAGVVYFSHADAVEAIRGAR